MNISGYHSQLSSLNMSNINFRLWPSSSTIARLFVIFCLYSLLCGQAFATWHEVTGSAPIRDGNIESARQVAINHALNQLLPYSGGQVSHSQSLTNGQLNNQQVNVKHLANIQTMQILSESITGQHINVKLHAQIDPFSATSCASNMKYNMALLPVSKSNPAHLLQNNLTALPTWFNQQLQFMLQGDNQSRLHVVPTPQSSRSITKSEIKYISQQQQTQLVLTVRIDDMSINTIQNANQLSKITQWAGIANATQQRQFAMYWQVYDGVTGETLFTKGYRVSSPWPYPFNQNIDVHSADFANSQYARDIHNTLKLALYDVNQRIQCMPLRTRVTRVKREKITVDVGALHNVKVGQRFLSESLEQTFMVTHVEHTSATLSSTLPLALANIQRLGILTLQP